MKYTEEITKEICDLIEKGASNKDAATIVGISEETFYKWQRPFEDDLQRVPNPEYHPELPESLKKATALRKLTLINRILMASHRSWQAAAWYLERQYPKEFGNKAQFQVETDPEDTIHRVMKLINDNFPEKVEEGKDGQSKPNQSNNGQT